MAFKFKISHQFIIFWLSLSAFLHNILMSGANNTIISSLQKEFYLTSKETGVYVSFYDIGSLISSVLISFICARGSKPKLISVGMIMVFLGCMVNVLPHFLKPHDAVSSEEIVAVAAAATTAVSNVSTTLVLDQSLNEIELCNYTLSIGDNGERTCTRRLNLSTSDYIVKEVAPGGAGFSFQLKHLLYLGNLINGMSTASLTTITFSYIEEIAPHRLSAIYESIYYVVGAFGVSIFKFRLP
jgi:MFS family permease